jgi:hypothetical protein
MLPVIGKEIHIRSRTKGGEQKKSSGIFYDPDYTGDEEGTFDEPYNDLKTAVEQAVYANYTVVLKGPVTSTALDEEGLSIPTGVNFTFKRSCAYSGYLFELSDDWSISDLIIDGNASSCPGSSSLISVTGGIITLGEEVTLQNNKAGNNGAAIRMLGGPGYVSDTDTYGSVVIDPSATITNNTPNNNFYYE